MKIVTYSNKGDRDINQDYFTSSSLGDTSSIYVVADGMGGYSSGEVAAKLVADSIVEFTIANLSNSLPIELLKQSIKYADECLSLKRYVMGVKEMGCVVVALLVVDKTAYFAWVGDSRLYIFKGRRLFYKSEDHSIVNQMAKIKTLKAADYEKYASIVTQAIMGDEHKPIPDLNQFPIEKGDTYILCTDGVHKFIPLIDLLNEDENALKSSLEDLSEAIQDNYSFIKITF